MRMREQERQRDRGPDVDRGGLELIDQGFTVQGRRSNAKRTTASTCEAACCKASPPVHGTCNVQWQVSGFHLYGTRDR
jgi:hypothetical protein